MSTATSSKYDFIPYYDGTLKWNPETMRDMNAVWDSTYAKTRQLEEAYWWENYARLPGDLAPEYRVWYWRTIGHWWWRTRVELWFSAPVASIVQGYWAVRVKAPTKWNPQGWHYEKRGFWNWWGKNLHKYAEHLRDWIGWPSYPSWCWTYCPHCGFTRYADCWIDVFDSDWFTFTDGGTRYIPGEPTQHWFEGVWTCPRCLRQWEYGDSD